MATQLAHVRVVLGQDGDGITLLPNDQPSLLLRCTAQVDAIELEGDMPRVRGPAAAWPQGYWATVGHGCYGSARIIGDSRPRGCHGSAHRKRKWVVQDI